MARPLTGSVRRRGNRWSASVPRLADPRKRVESSFATEAEARAWIGAQLSRREEGLEPEAPVVAPRPPAMPARCEEAGPAQAETPPARREAARHTPSLAALAAGWHREWYEELEHGGPDRAAQVWRYLELHVIPVFDDLLTCDPDTGRARVKDWLRALSGRRPLTPGSALSPSPTPYARQAVGSFLWVLRQVLAYARHRRFDVPDYAEGNGIAPLHPLGREKKRRAPVVSVADTAAIAGQLHVVHQCVLWLLRLCGLRISESYGLRVADFFMDEEGSGFLTVRRQGGRAFRHRTDDGRVEVRHGKDAGKTDSAYRLVVLPDPLTALISTVVDAFHTGADGAVDPTARLVPVIRSEGTGQGGFRSALKLAVAAADGPEGEDAYRIVPHDLRKGFATDLAWADDVSGLAARRAMGHRIGTDVFDLVYTLDSRLKAHLVPVARQIEQEIAAAGVDTLMVPTSKRPSYGTSIDGERIAHASAVLEAAGWQVGDCAGLLRLTEVAALVGRRVPAVRHLVPGAIPAVKVGGEWRCREADVLAFVERTRGFQVLGDVVERSGLDYYVVYRAVRRLGVATTSDLSTRGGALLLADADADRLLSELARVERLKARAVTLPRAAAMLRTSTSVVYQWAKTGRLVHDEERDLSGTRYVTLESVEAVRRARYRGPRLGVLVEEFKELTGFDDGAVRGLVKARLLVRARPNGLTPESVRTWAAGHRPTLLTSPILRRLSA